MSISVVTFLCLYMKLAFSMPFPCASPINAGLNSNTRFAGSHALFAKKPILAIPGRVLDISTVATRSVGSIPPKPIFVALIISAAYRSWMLLSLGRNSPVRLMMGVYLGISILPMFRSTISRGTPRSTLYPVNWYGNAYSL